MDHREAKRHNVVRQYMAGRLSTIEREDFEQHYFDCAECAARVRTMVQAGIMDADEAPAERGWRAWFGGMWFWRPTASQLLVPACLALVFTSYEAVTLRGRVEPQAVQTIHLEPDTRGAGHSVGQRAGEFIVLTADVPEIAQQWKWRIRSADGGAELVEGVVMANPGGVVSLLVPVGQFNRGNYILSVQDAGLVAPELTYRFRML